MTQLYRSKNNETKQTLLSIIIPVLNDEKALQTLLPYLVKYARGNEVIVVDANLSQDNSQDLSKSFDIKYVQSKKCGRACQMNEGAKIATGDILMFLHADVLPPSTFVKDIKQAVSAGNDAGFFAYNFSPSNRWLDINAKFTAKEGLFAGGGDQCQFMTKSTYDSLGGYDETYVIMEDFALMRKMKKSNIPLTIVQERATVSSRKYVENSYLWVNLVNFVVFMAFLLGVSPKTLKKMYTFSLK